MRTIISFVGVIVLVAMCAARAIAGPHPVAQRPPMGWNSWDAYGFTVTEDQFKANAQVLSRLRAYGWNTAIIDEGWYMANPLGSDVAARQYRYDAYGRLVPDPARFPTARDGTGLRHLADWTHARGMKFGLHIVRGIPKAAVLANAPIAGSSYHAVDAAVLSGGCPWDEANYDVGDSPAGQAWYDSLLQQYASWGVDFLKVDCIADHPFRPSEIRQIAAAISKSGRSIVLSLSPGPTKLEHAAEVRDHSQMWRIMDDLWDSWTFPHTDPNSEFPNGIRNAFDRLASWNPYVAPGSWPDADMLPFGALYPHPGWGDPRQSRLSSRETRTAFTLWAIARSPLILGANLTDATPDLLATLTNSSVTELNQGNRISRPLKPSPRDAPGIRIWVSGGMGQPIDTVAIFNIDDLPNQQTAPWTDLGFKSGRLQFRNLWTGATLPESQQVSTTVPGHGVLLLRLCHPGQPHC